MPNINEKNKILNSTDNVHIMGVDFSKMNNNNLIEEKFYSCFEIGYRRFCFKINEKNKNFIKDLLNSIFYKRDSYNISLLVENVNDINQIKYLILKTKIQYIDFIIIDNNDENLKIELMIKNAILYINKKNLNEICIINPSIELLKYYFKNRNLYPKFIGINHECKNKKLLMAFCSENHINWFFQDLFENDKYKNDSDITQLAAQNNVNNEHIMIMWSIEKNKFINIVPNDILKMRCLLSINGINLYKKDIITIDRKMVECLNGESNE